MARLLRMPEVAANATEAVLQEWSVGDGDAFAADDTIATVETEKAVVDVEAESAGVLLKTLVPAGAQVQVGAPIAVLGDPGEVAEDIDALLAELGVASETPSAAPERRTVPDPEGGTAETGDGVPADVPGGDTVTAVAAADGRTADGRTAEGRTADGGTADGRTADDRRGRVFASPLARRLAREAGLPVGEITGTGPGGRIIRRDVEAALAGRPAPAAAEATRAGRARPVAAAYTEEPHSKTRRAIATRLTESKQAIPHFYLRGTARVDRLLALRAELNEAAPVKISVNDLVVKAAARAHTLVPAMNVIWTPEAMRAFSSVDVSVAVATEKGLLTPVLRGVDQMSVSTLAATARDLGERARSGRLRQDELEGGALTVTNLGMFGTEEFAAIINPPQSAILAVGAARQEPVVDDGEIRPATVMRLTLSVDHRAVDGALAAEWMRTFLGLLERPLQILA